MKEKLGNCCPAKCGERSIFVIGPRQFPDVLSMVLSLGASLCLCTEEGARFDVRTIYGVQWHQPLFQHEGEGGPPVISLAELANAISASAGRWGMKIRSDIQECGWTFWELRSINRHRVVGFLTDLKKFTNAHDLEREIRSVISRNFKRAWWRGLAYGLSPAYREVLQTFSTGGYQVATAVREKDGLLKSLTGFAGARGIAFPQFHDNA